MCQKNVYAKYSVKERARMKRLILTIVLLSCMPVAPTAADDAPTVAILTFGTPAGAGGLNVQFGIFAVLQAGGFINADEGALLFAGMELEGEKLNILRGDAGFDFAAANALVETVLDKGASVLVTQSTPMTLAAMNATQDMENPPPIFFAQAVSPYESGIAVGPCDKADNVTGVEVVIDYAYVLELMHLQVPDMSSIGALHSSGEISGVIGARQIAEAAEAAGIAVEAAGATDLSELLVATEGLIRKGVDALVVPFDVTTSAGLPIIAGVAQENGVPLFFSSSHGALMGAAIGIGPSDHSEQGILVGHILAAHLNGALDIADTAISALDGIAISVNTTLPEVPIAPALAEKAETSITGEGIIVDMAQMEPTLSAIGLPMEQVWETLADVDLEAGISEDETTDAWRAIGLRLIMAALESEAGQAIAQGFLSSLSCAAM